MNTQRLLEEFAKGRMTVGDEWAAALAPEQLTAVERLAGDAAEAVEQATRADTPKTVEDADFTFPDEAWARVIYDYAIAARDDVLPMERLVASLIPLYFGRVAGLIIETKDLTTDRAEVFVERQARAFELAKPYLVKRWEAGRRASTQRNGRSCANVPPAAASRSAANDGRSKRRRKASTK